jgi:predicted RNA-binding protein YlxR (DUF448 family)
MARNTVRQCIICGKTHEPIKLIRITRLRLKVYVHQKCLEELRAVAKEKSNGDEPDWK